MRWLYPPVKVKLTVVDLVERRCLVAVHRHSLCVVLHVGYLNASFDYVHAHHLQHCSFCIKVLLLLLSQLLRLLIFLY